MVANFSDAMLRCAAAMLLQNIAMKYCCEVLKCRKANTVRDVVGAAVYYRSRAIRSYALLTRPVSGLRR
jgi:hypothetical protein